MKLRELLRKMVRVKPARIPVGGEDNEFIDVRSVERGGLKGSDWTAGQERPR